MEGFNTSHVTLYLFHFHSTTSTDFQVSIHHMLLFIRFLDTQYFFFPRFNTSHVTLYLRWIVIYALFLHVSIHHMLLFIFDNKSKCTCEIVSIHHMLLFITDQFFLVRIILLFQYITCYSLSMSI